MLGDRTMKKLDQAMEDAAVSLTMSQQFGDRLSPDQVAQGDEAAKQEVIQCASAAISKGHGDEVSRLLRDAEGHDMYRGADRSSWVEFVADIRSRLPE